MPQGVGKLEELCEFAINFLLSRQGDAKRLAVKLVEMSPARPALEMVFVLSTAAAGIEEVLASPETVAVAMDAWRVAALLGVDLHMMQARGLRCCTCSDLLVYWHTADGYFLA